MSLLDDCDAEVVRSPTKCETGARSFEIERESGGIKWRKTTIASGDYVADTATRYNMQIFILKKKKQTNGARASAANLNRLFGVGGLVDCTAVVSL